MAKVERTVDASREDVFAVLSDGWTYSDWVVGTAHIRAVDPQWPQPGSKIYHKAGPWPVSLPDRSVSLRCESPELLVLSPHLWPLGKAVVTITLHEAGPGRTLIQMDEDIESGPLRWLRTKANDLALHHRNRESIRRLADLARRRPHSAEGSAASTDREA
jgi:uncharacterized protein YndB with AHSA1/START domain